MREYWSDRMVEDHYRDLFMETHGYDPLDPFEEQDVDILEEDDYLKESLQQYQEGKVTAHELIEVEEIEKK